MNSRKQSRVLYGNGCNLYLKISLGNLKKFDIVFNDSRSLMCSVFRILWFVNGVAWDVRNPSDRINDFISWLWYDSCHSIRFDCYFESWSHDAQHKSNCYGSCWKFILQVWQCPYWEKLYFSISKYSFIKYSSRFFFQIIMSFLKKDIRSCIEKLHCLHHHKFYNGIDKFHYFLLF